jgi:hypothetical protein
MGFGSRRNKQSAPPQLSRSALEKIGSDILRRYNHPGHWVEGTSTGKPRHRGSRLLKVEEIRRDGSGFVTTQQAELNAQGIRALADLHGIDYTELIVDQQDQAPYIVVKIEAWDKVLAILKKL